MSHIGSMFRRGTKNCEKDFCIPYIKVEYRLFLKCDHVIELSLCLRFLNVSGFPVRNKVNQIPVSLSQRLGLEGSQMLQHTCLMLNQTPSECPAPSDVTFHSSLGLLIWFSIHEPLWFPNSWIRSCDVFRESPSTLIVCWDSLCATYLLHSQPWVSFGLTRIAQ